MRFIGNDSQERDGAERAGFSTGTLSRSAARRDSGPFSCHVVG